MPTDPVVEVTISKIKESQTVYPARSVDALLTRERNLAVERENAIKGLIEDTDNTFDDLCQSLSDIASAPDLSPATDYTMNELYARVNLLTSSLKQAYTALLGRE